MKKNILTLFLKELNIKHTDSFSSTLFEEHPYKYSLFGLSKMLSAYHIPNSGIKFKDKDVSKLDAPFIAHTGNDFVVVREIDSQTIDYFWNGKPMRSSIESFNKMWSGIVLVAEPDEQSIEPDYRKHRWQEILRTLQKSALWMLLSIGVLMLCVCQHLFLSLGLIMAFILNFLGIYIGCLLLMKQYHVESEYADRICSLFHQNDCNNVLESDAAKIGGLFSWSEIGLGYFISNMILIIGFPSLIPYLALVNICALPYTFWSVWYQYKVARQWCILCLIVQLLLWLLFFVHISMGHVQLPDMMITHLLIVGIVYLFPPLLINIVSATISKADKLQSVMQELNSLKNANEVFLALLKNQQHYEVSSFTSRIIFGNPKAELAITILTNPHCEPCAKMHKRVDRLLETAGNKLYVQYLFSSFSDELLDSNRFLISAYLHNYAEEAMRVYTDWFEKGKYNPEKYFEKFGFPADKAEVEAEMEKHNHWRRENHLSATPTILINGYQLPDKYKIEDLNFLTDINIS